MLVKAEMKKVPLCECPTFSKKELPAKDALAAASSVCDLPRSGKILVVDYYTAADKKLQGRFFSDGHKYITYLPESEKWDSRAPEKMFPSSESVSDKETQDMISEFLNIKTYCSRPTHYSMVGGYVNFHGPLALCADFASHQRYEINRIRTDAKYTRMRRHLEMFPDKYPKDVDTFLEQRAFQDTYIFFSKMDKQRSRTGRCACCGNTFDVPTDVKHNTKTVCPKCGKKATYCAEWRGTEKVDKAVLCYPMQKDGQLLMEFSKVSRTVQRGDKIPYYDIEPFANTLYLTENGKQKIYSYGLSSGYFRGLDWRNWGNTPVYREAYVYTGNLREIFGDKHNNVDIPTLMDKVTYPLDFARLLENLKQFPQTEYLCKAGMTLFASQIRQGDFLDPNARNIHDALGIRKQDVPLYISRKITVSEHSILREAKCTLDDTTIDTMRSLLEKAKGFTGALTELIRRMSMQKLNSYVEKQTAIGIGQESSIITWMRDYYNMSEYIGVILNRKNMFPVNIKQAHDELSEKIAKMRLELEEQASKEALETINNYFDGYGRNGYMIVVPQSKKDFIREGQELSHCVGSQPQYYKDHVSGTRMIFFVRAVKAPSVALYTAQIDMVTHRVIQCYGYGDKAAPPQVKKFVDGFARWLKKQKPKQIMQEAG